MFLSLTVFSLTTVLSQESKNILQTEKTVAAIDSVISSGNNIVQYIRPLLSDDGGEIFLKHRYTIDTVKMILYKAVYDLLGFEQITFYYNNQKILKAIVSDTSLKTGQHTCEYYFTDGSISSVDEQGICDTQRCWNKKAIASQANRYLVDFSGICDMLNKWK